MGGSRRGRYPRKTKGTKLLHNSVVVSTSLENTATETTFDNASYTLSGGKLRVGDLIEIDTLVWVEHGDGGGTLTLQLYVGTQVIGTIAAKAVATGDLAYIHALITVDAIGAGGYLSGYGFEGLTGGGLYHGTFKQDSTAENLSGALAIKLTGKWSAAHADDECECRFFSVKLTPVSGI